MIKIHFLICTLSIVSLSSFHQKEDGLRIRILQKFNVSGSYHLEPPLPSLLYLKESLVG